MKTFGFHRSCAPGIASVRPSRLFFHSLLRDGMAFRPAMAVLAVLTVLMAGPAGCTMCPDPFDYSGPVPNGSAPQNNFWSRSNGIIPLGTAPRPWPRIVQSEAASPALAEAETQEPDASGLGGEQVQPASVLVGEPPADQSAERTVIR
jgi:hypothetical protein